MTVVSGIWELVREEPEFRAYGPSVQEAARPYVEEIGTVLADHLAKPVNLATIMSAKLAYLKYLSGTNYMKDVAAATPDEELSWLTREEMVSMFNDAMPELLQAMEEFTKPAYWKKLLKQMRVTEAQVMADEKIGLRGEAYSMYKQGKLTIGKLLELQPIVLVSTKVS